MILTCGARRLDLSQPVVMGVLNVTPDSFSDGGRFSSASEAVAFGLQMRDNGAAIVDVGGESTRPGAKPVSLAEETDRVLPVVEALAREGVLVSVDTSAPELMRAAANAGAGLINDVRGFRQPGALSAMAGNQLSVIVMHAQGNPETMQVNPTYFSVVTDIKAFLAERLQACVAAGIGSDRIVIDPGFGFGKTPNHNLELLRNLSQFQSLGAPLLVGLSRKSLLGHLTGRPVAERLAGSLALAIVAAQAGARIVRVHDVRETVDVLRVLAATQLGS